MTKGISDSELGHCAFFWPKPEGQIISDELQYIATNLRLTYLLILVLPKQEDVDIIP